MRRVCKWLTMGVKEKEMKKAKVNRMNNEQKDAVECKKGKKAQLTN